MIGIGVYFYIRELLQVLSFCRLGIFWSEWVSDRTNWIDAACIVLTFFWVGFMWQHCVGAVMAGDFEGTENDLYRNGIAVTAAVFWLNLMLYLRTTSVDFAVFVGGVFFVLKKLATFLMVMAMLIVLIAFVRSSAHFPLRVCLPVLVRL
jgi:hypothetical protein